MVRIAGFDSFSNTEDSCTSKYVGSKDGNLLYSKHDKHALEHTSFCNSKSAKFGCFHARACRLFGKFCLVLKGGYD